MCIYVQALAPARTYVNQSIDQRGLLTRIRIAATVMLHHHANSNPIIIASMYRSLADRGTFIVPTKVYTGFQDTSFQIGTVPTISGRLDSLYLQPSLNSIYNALF